MALRVFLESVTIKKPWRTSVNRTSNLLFFSHQKSHNLILSLIYGHKIVTNVRDFCFRGRINHRNCYVDEDISSSPSVAAENIHKPPLEVDLESISDSRKSESKVGQTTNMLFGSTVIDGSTGEWLTLDQQVNTYPSVRKFTAIGIGGDDFVQSMVVAVESVIQHPIPQDHVKQRVSSGRKYVSVNIGPVRVVSGEQVRAVYSAMRSDDRMKIFL